MKPNFNISALITAACLAGPWLSAQETGLEPKHDRPADPPRVEEAQPRTDGDPRAGVRRAIQRKQLLIPPSEIPGVAGTRSPIIRSLNSPRWLIGVNVEALEPYVRGHLGIEPNTGLRVTQVMDGSSAEKAGIQVDDILFRADGKPLPSLEALKAAVEQAGEKRSTLEVEVLQKGERKSVHITPADTRPAPPEVPTTDRLRDRPIQQLTRRLNRQQREIETLRKEVAELRKKLEGDEQE